jgi:hypothetical protein
VRTTSHCKKESCRRPRGRIWGISLASTYQVYCRQCLNNRLIDCSNSHSDSSRLFIGSTSLDSFICKIFFIELLFGLVKFSRHLESRALKTGQNVRFSNATPKLFPIHFRPFEIQTSWVFRCSLYQKCPKNWPF